jgi:glycosyltransferase involved in cell wall biosynthesis
MLLSVVIPAYNEERCLPETLSHLKQAAARCPSPVEIIVVDNQSTDRTAAIAESHGAAVVPEAVHNIARVRNAGAAHARGDVLVFVDGDTKVPVQFLRRVAEVMADPNCLGGAADILHTPSSRTLRLYLGAWRLFGNLLGMAQGAAQFCRRSAFDTLGGYDESQFMGEDVDFYWRLKNAAARQHGHVQFLADVRVAPSPRRFDRWPLWRTLVWTNPLFIAIWRKNPKFWRDWYVRLPRS